MLLDTFGTEIQGKAADFLLLYADVTTTIVSEIIFQKIFMQTVWIPFLPVPSKLIFNRSFQNNLNPKLLTQPIRIKKNP